MTHGKGPPAGVNPRAAARTIGCVYGSPILPKKLHICPIQNPLNRYMYIFTLAIARLQHFILKCFKRCDCEGSKD